jgi:MoaA/NifB/PqqE/SkfB family radical SAM enzyme
MKGVTSKLYAPVREFRRLYRYTFASVKDYPRSLLIEPTNLCNLNCALCPCPQSLMKEHRKLGYMKVDDFKKIIDDIKGFCPKIRLVNNGEVFLNPNLIEMINYASKQDIKITTSTNATFDPKLVDEIIDSGLDDLIVSMNGATEQIYNKYNVGGDFNRVLENLKLLCARKRKMNKATPRIILQFLVTKYSEHEIPAIKKLAKEIGVDELALKSLGLPSWGDQDTLKRLAKEYLPEQELYCRYDKESLQLKLPRCSFPSSCVILWNGDVSVCCEDMYAKHTFGNALERSFLDIWDSKEFVNCRKIVKKRGLDICKRCPE